MTREELLKHYKDGRRDFSYAYWAGANLSGAYLSGAYLSGADWFLAISNQGDRGEN